MVLALAVAGLLVAAACGDDDGDTADDTTTTADDTTTTAPGAGDGAITIDDLELRCDELTDIATELRGEAPASSEAAGDPPGPSEVQVDDEPGYVTSTCIYAYEGDSIADPNRVTLRIERAIADTPAVQDAIFDSLSFDTEIPDLGDAARYLNRTTVDTISLVHVRVGDSVATVRVGVPSDLEGEPYLAQEPMVAAAREFLDRIEL